MPQVEGDTKPRERYEAIVVGAGLSGLACAAALANAGIRVRVLEARDRIGGRVFTIRDFAEGRPIEGGALMVHGRKNSVFRYAKSFDLGLRRIPVPWRTLFAMDGRARSVLTMGVPFLPPFGLQATYQGLFRLPRRFSRYQGANVPLERFLEDQGICRGARVLINFFYAHAFAADPDEIGVLGLAEEMKYQTGEWPWVHFQFVDGYNSVAERLAKGLDCVELRTKVTSIDWSSKGVHIEAETEKGLELYEADRAVVTVPLGVLKSGDIAFDPPLPQRKQRAIAGLGNGSGLITLILFDAALSTKGLAPFVFLGGESSTFFFKPLFGIKAAPTVLSCFTTGREAQRLATMSSQEAVDEILSELERLLPRVDFQNHLVGARVINWMQDPFARGVYSFPKAGGTMEMRTDLAAPLDNVLFFAGEATNFCGEAQTTNGAIDSGRRAASEVLLTLGIGSSAGDR